jgi:hypothetical protein
MKALLLILALLAPVAHATEWANIGTHGEAVYLTQQPCAGGGNVARYVSRWGESATGCWFNGDPLNLIVVYWGWPNVGAQSAYPRTDFVLNKHAND